MNNIELPSILNIPKKLLPLILKFNDYRIFLIDGGRGGAKSHSVARLLLYLNEKYKLRTACGRETQDSIKESVHQLLSELVNQYQLNFDIQTSRIIHREKGSEFIFLGLREQGRYNIKSLEGIDILWIEEGQALTKPTMDVVLPTIRKPQSKIFVTMNRHLENDPAYVMLKGRPDCLHLSISYLENEHCTDELKKEADICKAMSQKDYQHIWLGEPLAQAEDALYSRDEIMAAQRNAHQLAKGYGLRVGAFDIARYGDDKCAVVVYQQMGALHWEEVFSEEWEKRDLNYTTGRILTTANEQGLDMYAIDEDGLGSGPLDTLTQGRKLQNVVGFRNLPLSFKENAEYANMRTAAAYKKKNLLMKGHLCMRNPKLIEECLTIRYGFDHYQRRILISKDEMKKKGFKSPNLFDASNMAVSLMGQVQQKQSRQYEANRYPQYSDDGNLFGIAGIL